MLSFINETGYGPSARFMLILIALLTAGCRSSTEAPGTGRAGRQGTYIVSEGVFAGGGSLGFYDREEGKITSIVSGSTADWLFPNDISIVGERGYVAVNGSGRIDVLDLAGDSIMGTVAAVPAASGPGYLVHAGAMLYAANYDGTVSAIDLNRDSVAAVSAPVVGFPGGFVRASGRLFVSDLGAWPDTGRWVRVVDPANLVVTDSILLGGAPAGMTVWGDRLFVATSVSMQVFEINSATLEVLDTARLSGPPGDIVTDGSFLYVMTPDGVDRISLAGFDPDSSRFIARAAGLFYYALGIDPSAGELIVSNIVSPGGSGVVEVYDFSGVPLGSAIPAGIFPGAFASIPVAPKNRIGGGASLQPVASH